MTAPSSQFDRFVLISRLAASGQWERLLETGRDWLADEPENGSAHRYVGQALVNLKRHAEAEPHLAKAIAANPADPFSHRLMAIAKFGLKKYREADQAIHQAIELNPNDAMNWYHLAWMCHQQHDAKNAVKWSSKALELDPDNPDILNLHAICGGALNSPTTFQSVLAMDPENAPAHNNLGVYYLNEKDSAKAEECFRRALTIDPTLKVARRNLLLVVKRRDRIYQILCAPRDFLFSIRNALLGNGQKRNFGAVLLGFVVWIVAVRFFIFGLALWFGLVWPMVKVYEFLVIGDLRKKAGEIGTTRGGILGYRQWSPRVRIALFGAALVAFWTTVYLAFWGPWQSGPQAEAMRDNAIVGVVTAGVAGLLIFLGYRGAKGSVQRYHSWRRHRRLRNLETIES